MAGTPALRPTAKRFSPILLEANPNVDSHCPLFVRVPETTSPKNPYEAALGAWFNWCLCLVSALVTFDFEWHSRGPVYGLSFGPRPGAAPDDIRFSLHERLAENQAPSLSRKG